MKQSEKRLMIATGICVVAFAGWNMGLGSLFDSATAADSNIRGLESTFEKNLVALSEYYEIESEFRLVGVPPGDGAGSNFTPALAFQQEVYNLAAQEGFNFPNTLRAEMEEIPGVEQYVLLSVAIKTEGKYEETVKLLKRFEQTGMIFRELELSTSRDNDRVTGSVTVARITERPARGGRIVRRAR